METVIKQSEENRARSLSMANRVHEEYLPLKSEIDHMRREYLGLDRLPDLHEEEGNTITPEYVFFILPIQFILFQLIIISLLSSRFQNYYPNKSHQASSSNFSRPPLSTHHQVAQETVTSLAPTAPPGFLPPPPVGSMRMTNKPQEMGSNRLSQPPSIGMGHPTFRSDFNVNLR